MTVDGLTITPSADGDYSVMVTLNDRLSIQVPVHVHQNIQSLSLVAPKWYYCKGYQGIEIPVCDIVPADDINRTLTWYWNGAKEYIDTADSHEFYGWYYGKNTVRVTAPGGASAEAEIIYI